ncbi:hypothetical protein BKA70DRAFT_1346616 [Coprinopsis sp. MPI-PUGE-AT-0042]|nr:hypothetical protein BKA70DRAFT_1346616 [Coprinopsis sp. MPI-PUGE-AT-0042]
MVKGYILWIVLSCHLSRSLAIDVPTWKSVASKEMACPHVGVHANINHIWLCTTWWLGVGLIFLGTTLGICGIIGMRPEGGTILGRLGLVSAVQFSWKLEDQTFSSNR